MNARDWPKLPPSRPTGVTWLLLAYAVVVAAVFVALAWVVTR